ncbi:unnamed protein product [Phytomonas sp. EM1]|nr:unnamed protein product [Phytomonas sp. EM1]|eukprot:CCW60991.1 unnamed protein product [Phytomonas sp. isolate EM1]
MERDEGRFFYINGILCKTFADDGSFRPSDIFPHLEADFDLPSLAHSSAAPGIDHGNDEAHVVVDERNADSITQSVRPNLDDPILNSFGVMSKGVLMDPWDRCFVDFTDPQVFTPSLFRTSEPSDLSSHGTLGPAKELRKKRSNPGKRSTRPPRKQASTVLPEGGPTPEELRSRNAHYYETGEFQHVRGEACIILCSSLEPLDRSASLEAWKTNVLHDATPFSWPYSNKYLSHSTLNSLVGRYVKWIFTACKLPAAAVDPRTDRHRSFVDALTFMEKYRLLMKIRKPQSTYLPAGIPFPFQLHGRALGGEVQGEASEANNQTAEQGPSKSSNPSQSGEMRVGDGSPLSSSSPASSFGCFTGKPTMCRGGYSTIRTDIFSRSNANNVALDIGKYVMPLRALDCKRAREMLREIERPYLYPPKHLSRWARAWWIFCVYFSYLGLVGGPFLSRAKTNASAEESSSSPKSEASRFECKLCPDDEYSVSAEVHRKCLDEDALWHAEDSGSDRMLGSLSPSKSEIADVWNFMICNEDRDRILERLSRIESYLDKLTSSTFESKQIKSDSA